MNTPAPESISGHSLARTSLGQTLATGVLCVAFLTLVQRGIGLGRSLVICDWLPTGELGKWDLWFTFLMAVGPLVVLGVPGALGRFAERFRRRNQIARFIKITSVMSAGLFGISAVGLVLFHQPLSHHLLGGQSRETSIYLLMPALAMVVLFNYLTALMNSLRLHSGFAKVQAVQGIGFAVLCLVTVPLLEFRAIGVVVAYAAACALSSVLSMIWLRRSLAGQPQATTVNDPEISSTGFLGELLGVARAILPFAMAIWLATLIANGFRMTDRLLIVNLSTDQQLALFLVGQYHAARIFPRLLSQFAMTLAAVVTPHLSESWDRGRTDLAAEQLGSFLKLLSAGFCVLSIPILIFAPFLFSVLMQEKFDVAVKLLPWTLATGVIFSLAFVLQNAFWCAKRAWWTSIALVIGLGMNVLAGLVLFPAYGIEGVVLSTFFATVTVLGLMLVIARRIGFCFSCPTYLALGLPCALVGGSVGCVLVAIVLAAAILLHETWVTDAERKMVVRVTAERFQALRIW